VVHDADVTETFTVTAMAGDLIMGMRHPTKPLEGVQFHPESVLTQHGYMMIATWLTRCGATDARDRAVRLSEQAEVRRSALPNPA